jgi:hypothetical protein
VDGLLQFPNDRYAGRFYLFTQVTETGPPRPGRKTPEAVGREGLWRAVVATYAAVFPVGHPCHTGPAFGKVVQEGHPNSTVQALVHVHNHGAFAFPADHKWKAVERHLRVVQGIKVGCLRTQTEASNLLPWWSRVGT